MDRRCEWTVRRLTTSLSATCASLIPRATRRSTSISRDVNPRELPNRSSDRRVAALLSAACRKANRDGNPGGKRLCETLVICGKGVVGAALVHSRDHAHRSLVAEDGHNERRSCVHLPRERLVHLDVLDQYVHTLAPGTVEDTTSLRASHGVFETRGAAEPARRPRPVPQGGRRQPSARRQTRRARRASPRSRSVTPTRSRDRSSSPTRASATSPRASTSARWRVADS